MEDKELRCEMSQNSFRNKYIPVLLSASDKVAKNEMTFAKKCEDAWVKWRRLHAYTTQRTKKSMS